MKLIVNFHGIAEIIGCTLDVIASMNMRKNRAPQTPKERNTHGKHCKN
jgi:hypothetical protein